MPLISKLKGLGSEMTGMMEMLAKPIAALTLAVWILPLLLVARRVLKAPLRTWVPIICFVVLILTLQFVDGLLGPDGMMALIYLLAGAGSR